MDAIWWCIATCPTENTVRVERVLRSARNLTRLLQGQHRVDESCGLTRGW
jgi:hypothetical protein